MKIIKKFFIVFFACCSLLLNSNEQTKVVLSEESQIGFYNEFNDLSESDISYKKGNNTTFTSHDLTYYASSFSFNSVTKQLQFGRNTSATTNIGEEDELSMEFDLGGYIEYLKLDIGTININSTGSNIIFKVKYSLDFGNTYIDVEGSEKELTGNELYSLYINNTYDSIRFKFVITNVNNVAGKNMVINSLTLLGSKIYAYSISHLIKIIDGCSCQNIRTEYENIVEAYEALSESDKLIFNDVLTEDGQTTYLERLNYYVNICTLENEENENNNLTETQLIEVQERHIIILVIVLSITVLLCFFILLILKKKKQ